MIIPSRQSPVLSGSSRNGKYNTYDNDLINSTSCGNLFQIDMEILIDVRNLLNKTKMMLSEKTEEDSNNNFGFVVEGIFLVIVALLGVVGNVLCIIAFSVKRNKNTFHHLMLGKDQI